MARSQTSKARLIRKAVAVDNMRKLFLSNNPQFQNDQSGLTMAVVQHINSKSQSTFHFKGFDINGKNIQHLL